MDERWHAQPAMRIRDDDRAFVDEHERAARHNRKACTELLKRLQGEGRDPYAVVTPVPVLSRNTKEKLKKALSAQPPANEEA
jgi:hypothetical protein